MIVYRPTAVEQLTSRLVETPKLQLLNGLLWAKRCLWHSVGDVTLPQYTLVLHFCIHDLSFAFQASQSHRRCLRPSHGPIAAYT